MGISQYQLVKGLHIPQTRVSAIVRGKRRITADTALRLSRYFATSARFWLGLQADYDLEESGQELEGLLDNIPRADRNAA